MANQPTAISSSHLPPERAFVLQLDAATDPHGGEVGGRVEHVVSGNATRFRSASQLLAFLRAALAPRGGAEAAEDSPAKSDPGNEGR
jgi:hypothetical protein